MVRSAGTLPFARKGFSMWMNSLAMLDWDSIQELQGLDPEDAHQRARRCIAATRVMGFARVNDRRNMRDKIAVAWAALAAMGLVAMILALGGPAQAQDVKVCESTFALCTVARCEPIPGNDKQVNCHCTVNKGYSAGLRDCAAAVETSNGWQILSRYFPIKSYAVCSNSRPWAACGDKPCLIDKNNPVAADCTCDLVKDLGPYVVVTGEYTPATCSSGLISSATVRQTEQITEVLKKSKVLPSFPLQVLNR
jgi:hypothetical protein